ncbi:flavin reductase [Amycolatopsis sp. GM8]|uniref:flavin reductase n=1 Tax=Amycolatopsis sp. GM8 TaxID=2896530 RepID=UPI001F02C437|nr:flavin reductase [Amycolatopsis sp. GM8]
MPTGLDAQFREGMARLGSGVCVITSDGPAGRLGFTATAVCSVTDTPPTLLVCMNRRSQQSEPFRRNGVLAVNVLAGHHRQLSQLFSGATQDMSARFAHAEWLPSVTGAPLLSSAVAAFDCTIENLLDIGTHSVMLGRVIQVVAAESDTALVYYRRSYHEVGNAHT